MTRIAVPDNHKKVYEFIKTELKQGNQAFVVCPVIEENEESDIKLTDVTKFHQRLQNEILKGFKIGILHGRMKASEKEETMSAFQNREYDVLVATTVIEVGVNIPNATVMVIENAERFGLATLHQLRGRVGRGSKRSYCFLNIYDKKAFNRLTVMEKSTDGFKISEFDLKNRGPGEFFGTKQHGLPSLKLSNIIYNMETVNMAKEAADSLFSNDPGLEGEENKSIRKKVNEMFYGKLRIGQTL
jgi:ATP-dependent DNA helicase RecG